MELAKGLSIGVVQFHAKIDLEDRMSQKLLLASIGCGLMVLAGIIRLILRDWQVGVLLIGFALTLRTNIHLEERLRSLQTKTGLWE